MKGKGIQLNPDFSLSLSVARGTDGKVISGLQIGDTLAQNQALILGLQPGELRLSPVVGVGIDDMIDDNEILEWKRKIRQQMELDGQQIDSVTFFNNELEIDGRYKDS